MSQALDASGQRVSTLDLLSGLEEALSCHFARRCGITALERRPSAYSSSWSMEELDVRLDDGTFVLLMFKDLSPSAKLPAYAKPDFLYNPLREIDTYRLILARRCASTAHCYGAVTDPAASRYWLFLERVPGSQLTEVGEFATWQQVARWLAVLHNQLSSKAKRLAHGTPLLRYNGKFYRHWLRRAQACLGAAPARRRNTAGRSFDRLVRSYDRAVEHLLELPVTVIHGEFYASNVLVQQNAPELRVCPIDWEMAALGPRLVDLAALTAGKWSEEERLTLALAYHAELAHDSGAAQPQEEFLAQLDHCRLHLAVQWLGWSSCWSPSPKHAQDWMGQALGLVDKLGL